MVKSRYNSSASLRFNDGLTSGWTGKIKNNLKPWFEDYLQSSQNRARKKEGEAQDLGKSEKTQLRR
jgi:hypothetical protein